MSQPVPTVRHVFVYGTLRRGEQRDINRLQPAPVQRGWARVPGVLYDLGAYPGLRLGGQGSVLGEVYEVSADLERQLDAIEEVWPQPNGEYLKREVLVRLEARSFEGGREIVCVLYEIAPGRATGKPLIASGDWVQYRAGNSA
ncbi:gamma-glutamylcyclotransferase family protein [Polaromonas sp.]|uniref:gamma-glutamylcyclotransferase family protein n=1 Tax=Polaromonas sp. TaxID=1869339 RepID=UPI00286C2165|nr:gamma-glutamylcyclotransferase family protein [Polaromonas sp.]